MHRVTGPQELFHPGHKLARRESPGRLGQELIVLRYRHVKPGVHIQTDLDDRPQSFILLTAILSEAAPS